jgi:plastocyanin
MVPKTFKNTKVIVSLFAVLLIIIASTVLIHSYTNNKPSKNIPHISSLPLLNASIDITDKGFNPASLSIKPHTHVVWTNSSGNIRSIKITKNNSVINKNDPVNTNNTYTYTFQDSGTYYYQDELSKSSGQIIVL